VATRQELRMQIDCEEFDGQTGGPENWGSETIFTCCSFRGLEISGGGVDGAMIFCGLQSVDWYWGFFNAAVLSRVTFKDCVFRGCSFRGVDLVGCSFQRCRFLRDNLGRTCVFQNCRLVECAFDECEILVENQPGPEPAFSRTRFYGCKQSRSAGLERLF
jgi:fluoroquinolone resistance protein